MMFLNNDQLTDAQQFRIYNPEPPCSGFLIRQKEFSVFAYSSTNPIQETMHYDPAY